MRIGQSIYHFGHFVDLLMQARVFSCGLLTEYQLLSNRFKSLYQQKTSPIVVAIRDAVLVVSDKIRSRFQSTYPVRGATVMAQDFNHFNLTHPMRGATVHIIPLSISRVFQSFQSNTPRAGCDSKTIQFKRILVARRMYSFAKYVLHTLKHSPIYCIGTTLQPLIFGAKLPVILCQLNVRTILITLLYHTSLLPASAFAAIKSHRPNGVMRVKYT